MARARHNGNPGPPAGRYLMPSRSRARLRPALLAGGAVLLALGALYAVGARGALQPGPLVAVHATSTGGRCHECHASMPEGASEIRCQRCHDPAGGGRYTHVGHVARIASVGRGGASTMAGGTCADCHVEHRGTSGLARVDERRCAACHALDPSRSGMPHAIPSLAGHPEFHAVNALVARGTAPPPVEATGLSFSHDAHSLYVARDMKRRTGDATLQRVCDSCHQLAPSASGRRMDFAPITFDEHCVACHQKQLPMTVAVPGPCDTQRERLVCGPDGARALVVEHADPWVLARLAAVRRALDPAAHDAERATLLARSSQLRRRLVLAAPYATLGTAQLEERKQVFADELAALEVRLKQGKGGEADAARRRVLEMAAALDGAGRADAAAGLKADATAALPEGGALRGFEDRREELLALLAEIDAAADRELRNPAASADGGTEARRRKARAAEIRRRTLAVVAGEDALLGLRRARDERAHELRRVADEIALREDGVPVAPMSDRERPALEAQLTRALARLRVLDDAAAAPVDDVPRDRLVASVDALLGVQGERCRMCHVVRGASIIPVKAATRVLPLSPFVHQPHLGARPPNGWPARGALPKGLAADDVRGQATSCTPCHARTGGGPEIQFSQKSGELHVMGIDGCRSCHFGGGIRDGCQVCHRYHPPPAS